MSDLRFEYGVELERSIYRLYREYFDQAERRRRWSLEFDIPWDQANNKLPAAIADVVETFCAVELFLPDYVGKFLPMGRSSRGRSWFVANWGYEESKHSLALGDWLLKSGMRTEEDIERVEGYAIANEWELPSDDNRALVCYTMAQEIATWAHYRNLRQHVGSQIDPALHTLLGLVATDERAHFDFYAKLVRLHLDHDREGTLEQLRRVLNNFQMPALYLLADSARRIEQVKSLGLFDERQFYELVYLPILARTGVTRQEMRNPTAGKKSLKRAVVE